MRRGQARPGEAGRVGAGRDVAGRGGTMRPEDNRPSRSPGNGKQLSRTTDRKNGQRTYLNQFVESKTKYTTGGSGRGRPRWGVGAEKETTGPLTPQGIEDNCPGRFLGSTDKRNPMQTGVGVHDTRFISGTAEAALRSWLLTSGPLPFCRRTPFMQGMSGKPRNTASG